MKESKEDRFCRVAEARVNKIIKMMRLLGNCSNNAVYKVYKEQINNLQRQIDRYMELKAALYEDYAEGTITAEDYVAMGQEYAQKADELRIFLSEIKKESRKYDPEYLGGEHWAKLVADFKDQKTLDRKMVEAFVNKLTLYNDGRAEIEFNFRDELEEVLLWAAMRKKEVNKYAG